VCLCVYVYSKSMHMIQYIYNIIYQWYNISIHTWGLSIYYIYTHKHIFFATVGTHTIMHQCEPRYTYTQTHRWQRSPYKLRPCKWIHINIFTQLLFLHTNSETCRCVHQYMNLSEYTHMYEHQQIHIYMYACTYTYTRIYTYIHTFTYTCMHAHIHLHV